MEGWEGDADDDEAGRSAGELLSREMRGDENAATAILTTTTLIVGMIGGASGLAGVMHWYEWSEGSRLVGTGVGLIACTLDLLVLGYGSKQWDLGCREMTSAEGVVSGCTNNHIGWRPQMLAWCAVLGVVLQAVYVAVLFTTSTSTPKASVD